MRLKLLTKLSGLVDYIKDTVKTKLGYTVQKSAPQIEEIVKNKFREHFQNSEFYREATSGRLQGELGLPVGESYGIIDNLINNSVDLIEVKYIPDKKYPKIVVKLKDGYVDDLLAQYETIVSEGGYELPWLEWLLTYGSKKIITNFRFKPMFYGRSLEGIMVKGGSWGLDSALSGKFAGTRDDNIITRVLEEFKQELELDITSVINSNV